MRNNRKSVGLILGRIEWRHKFEIGKNTDCLFIFLVTFIQITAAVFGEFWKVDFIVPDHRVRNTATILYPESYA